MAAGSIVVDLLMRTAGFQTDTKRAEKALKDLEASAKKVGSAIGLAVSGAAVASAVMFDQLVKAAGEYQDLADMTGASGEAMASYAVAAATAGVSMDSVSGAMLKLTKNLTGVDDESKAAGAALGALGINVADFKKLDPAAQYEALGKALNGFEDGASKAAVAQVLLGKAGAEQLKVFKALEDQGGRTTILTQEQIELADAYADEQAKLTAELKLYAQAAATQMLPALNDLTKAFSDVFLEMIGVDKVTGELAANNGVKEFAESAANALAFVADAVLGVWTIFSRTGEFLGATGAAIVAKVKGDTEGLKAIQDAYNASLETGFKSVRGRLDDRRAESAKAAGFVGPPGPAGPAKPQLKYEGAGKPAKAGNKDDPTKKLLDNQIKELERGMQRERDLMSDRNEFLELYNGQGLISIQSYYDAQRTIMEAATSSQITAYDKQLALLREHQKKATKKTDKADDQGKIDDVIDKRSKLEQEAGKKSIILNIQQTESERKLQQEIVGVNASVLELQGNLAAAAAIRFDQQNLDLVRRLTNEGNVGALAQLDTLRKMTIAQARYAEEAVKAGRTLEELRIAEDYIAIARKSGATTELGALQQTSEARARAITQMEAMVTAQETIAKASGNPDLVLNAQRARVELEGLRASLDPLADEFRGLFEDSFGDAFAGFIDGSKTAKEAADSFFGSVSQQITRMATQNFAEVLFGKDGALGGVSGALSELVTGKREGAGTPGKEGALGGAGGLLTGILGGKASAAKPSIDTLGVATSLATLQVNGIDPTTSALVRLRQAVDGAAGTLGGKGGAASSVDVPWESDFPSGGSGEASSSDDVPQGSGIGGASGVSAVTEASESSLSDFGKTASDATSSILKLADAAGQGGGALGRLPQLLQGLFSSIGGASGGGSGSEGGGMWGTIFSAAISYFGGAKAGGGDVLPGRSYLVGEMGPERFVPRTSGTILTAQQSGGAAAQRPIQITQQFAAGTNRATVDQAAAQAGAAVRRAVARTR